MSQPGLDPVSVAVLILTAAVGERYATVVGPYVVICMAWFAGVLIGVYRSPPGSRTKLVVFVLATLCLTLGLTVPAADLVARYTPINATALLFPVAVLIPAVGEDWIPLVQWAWGLWRRRKEVQEERQP